MFQSPPMTHGPRILVSTCATAWRMARFSSVSPSVCLSHTDMTWRPPFHTAFTCATAMRCLNPSGTILLVLPSMPNVVRAATKAPPLALSAAVLCASVHSGLQFIFRAALAAFFRFLSPRILSSCATTMSAAVRGSQALRVCQELAFAESIAQSPFFRHPASAVMVMRASHSFFAAAVAASSISSSGCWLASALTVSAHRFFLAPLFLLPSASLLCLQGRGLSLPVLSASLCSASSRCVTLAMTILVLVLGALPCSCSRDSL